MFIYNLYLISFCYPMMFASTSQYSLKKQLQQQFKQNSSLFLSNISRNLEAVSVGLIRRSMSLGAQTFQFPTPTALIHSSLHIGSDRKEEEQKRKGQKSHAKDLLREALGSCHMKLALVSHQPKRRLLRGRYVGE